MSQPWMPAPPHRRTGERTFIRSGQEVCEQVSWWRFVWAALTGGLGR